MTVIIMVALYFMYWVILVLPRSVAALWGFSFLRYPKCLDTFKNQLFDLDISKHLLLPSSLNVGIAYFFQVTTIPIHFLTDSTAAFAVKYLYPGLHLDEIS